MREPRTTPSRLRLICRGAVQGVGFRPAVYRLATSLGLGGWVQNDPDGVIVEVEGPESTAYRFAARLPSQLPPLARLDTYEVVPVELVGEVDFQVRPSRQGRRRHARVPADAALCDDCRREMEDPHDRRFQYPFTTCTHCGPRFSLVRRLPYDRVRTSMSCFPFCPDCDREYTAPEDRRFHAEPVCCPACGPSLWLLDGEGHQVARGPTALEQVRQALADGAIVALKALGGFQLACRADRDEPCRTLRERKSRPTKPLALMARDLPAAHRLVHLDEADEACLRSAPAPIVLSPRRREAPVAAAVAPGLHDLGVMLPTTPLHVELFRGLPCEALVMTSANRADEPICRGNREAVTSLGGIADLFLVHDRDVVRRVDDSIVRSSPDGPRMVRRARGHVPDPLPLPVESPAPVLALGGFLQVTACLAVGSEAFLSQHVGDLDSVAARDFHEEVVAGLLQFLEVQPELVVVDAHPDYPSSNLGERLSRDTGARILRVQHHLAHVAAVLAEHGRFPEPGQAVAGLALDGTGFGPDGTAWGGEFLTLDGELSWQRHAHLEAVPLVGGERAVRQPWRVAVALLQRAGGLDLLPRLPLGEQLPVDRLAKIAQLAESPQWPRATGAGRLFEAAGALFGPGLTHEYEGEAAARFESLAAPAWDAAMPWTELTQAEVDPGTVLPSGPLLHAAAKRLAAGQDPAEVAAGFHATFCELAVATLKRVLPPAVNTVAAGGGCLVNRLLHQGLQRRIQTAGLEFLAPQSVPAGDGGLSLGQATLAAVSLDRHGEPRISL